MKLKKFNEFLMNEKTEPFNDSPETYIDITLKKLKGRIEAMFGNKPKKKSTQTPEQAREKKAKKTFEELGLKLESCEISKYSKLYHSLTVKFSDEKYLYNLYVQMKLEDAIAKEPGTEVEQKNVDEASIVFKKYNIQTLDEEAALEKNINTDKITEDYLMELKLELDKDFGDEEEESFEIET
jgi:hypothetical protein